MNKLLVTGAIMAVTGFSSQAVSTGHEAQLDALQNEILKIKQDMSSDKSKAYFAKGKGMSIKSADGKYSFQIKGRAMYDVSTVASGNIINGGSDQETFGTEFRRLRFSLRAKVGDGWEFRFQPDFAETVSDNSNTSGKGVDVKDALISKKLKGIGKLSFGNVKSAGGMWENTSSNSILFMERPMYNETANLAHRSGIHYDTAGAFGKKNPFHLKATLAVGPEGGWRQEQENSITGEQVALAVAAHYTHAMGKKHKLLLGGSYTRETHPDDGSRKVEARAQGVHTFGDKINGGAVDFIESYSYGGPQIAYTNGPLFAAAEYYWITGERDAGASPHDDFEGKGGAAFVHYFLTGGASVNIKEAKGGIGGVKCKAAMGCTAVKAMFEHVDTRDSEMATDGTHGKAVHIGVNHYFNSNVRLMVDAARGIYLGGTDVVSRVTQRYTPTTVQARLHLKF